MCLCSGPELANGHENFICDSEVNIFVVSAKLFNLKLKDLIFPENSDSDFFS